MEKEQICELLIEDISSEGSGIGRAGGLVVFVDGALPGDRIRARFTKVKKNYALADLEEIIEYSEHRSDEFDCPYSGSRKASSTRKTDGRTGSGQAADGLPGGAQVCGGCPYSQLEYEAQLEIKQKQVRDKLERIAGVTFSEEATDNSEGTEAADNSEATEAADNSEAMRTALRAIIGADAIYGYRNKAVMPISTGGLITKKGGITEPEHEPRIGFRPSKSHEVIDCKTCLLQPETAMAAAYATRQFMKEDHICSFDPRWRKGLMKSMMVKTAFGTGEVMVIYDINGKGIPNAAKLIEYLDSEIYEAGGNLESVVIRMDKKSGADKKSGPDKKTETLAGKPTITDIIEVDGRELRFEISADSFYQVNHDQMQNLYSVVRSCCRQAAGGDFAENAAKDSVQTGGAVNKPIVFDLYCGIGTIGLCVADIAEHVYGIEIVKQAVIDANRNATINGIVNATYTCGKAEEEMEKLLGDGAADVTDMGAGSVADAKHACIAILDPPRAGCREELLETIAEAGIKNIIYVSCDPATLARDVKVLREKGYELIEVTPVDMFPHTGHVETVVLMSRVKD